MITKGQVQQFLNHFHQKIEVFGVTFRDDRDKNRRALIELGITPRFRIEILKELEYGDYSQGPIIDELNEYGELWVFGKDVNDCEVYIKITLSGHNMECVCVSFHVAEYPMNYPLKDQPR